MQPISVVEPDARKDSARPAPLTPGRPWLLHRGNGLLITSTLAPWLWFVVRDHWIEFDAVALAMPPITAVSVVLIAAVAAVRRSVRIAVPGISLLAVAITAIVGPWLPVRSAPPVAAIRMVSANVLYLNRSPAAAAGDVIASHPDVVVLVEVTKAIDRAVRRVMPYGFRRNSGDYPGSEAVYSRWPLRVLPFPTGSPAVVPGVHVEVERPGDPVEMLALHVPVPARGGVFSLSLKRHRQVIDWARRVALRSKRPMILAGDFNLSDRMRAYRSMAGSLRDAVRSGWVGPTARSGGLPYLLLRTDHIFIPKTWCATGGRLFTVTGSDHRAVAAQVGRCPRAQNLRRSIHQLTVARRV